MSDRKFDYEERAAIKEYCGNMSREQAEREAAKELKCCKRCGKQSPETLCKSCNQILTDKASKAFPEKKTN